MIHYRSKDLLRNEVVFKELTMNPYEKISNKKKITVMPSVGGYTWVSIQEIRYYFGEFEKLPKDYYYENCFDGMD